jgi:hypothetical protein
LGLEEPGLDRHEWESEWVDVDDEDVAEAIGNYRELFETLFAERRPS